MSVKCPICLHDFAPEETDRHHLIPQCRGGKKKAVERLCKQCHKQIHALFTEKELEREYASLEALLAAPEMQKYIGWARKRRPNGRLKMKRAKRRR